MIQPNINRQISNRGTETMRRTETVMTNDQWERRFKKALKKTIRQKLNRALQYLVLFLLMVGLPLGMIAHWLIVGY